MSDELSEGDLKQIGEYTVYEGNVELWRWQETSSAGFKVVLKLPQRSDLDYFDSMVARRKGKAGHLFQCVLWPLDGDANWQKQMEAQYWGRNWSETIGATFALHFHGDDQRWWKTHGTRDQGEPEIPGFELRILIMERGDDGRLINQARARAVTAGQQRIAAEREKPEPIKGGPKSKNVAIWMQDTDVLEWLNEASIYQNQGPFESAADIDALVKAVCQIDSKREFDHNPAAFESWENQFNRPFLQWGKQRYG